MAITDLTIESQQDKCVSDAACSKANMLCHDERSGETALRVQKSRKPSRRQTPICVLSIDTSFFKIEGELLTSKGEKQSIEIQNNEQVVDLKRKLGNKGEMVILLPKSDYLIRCLSLPKAEENEVRQMVQLEMAAQLPPEFGQSDVAYRCCGQDEHGGINYEVYVARQSCLQQYLRVLGELNLTPDYIFPSALIWDRVLDVSPEHDFAGARLGPIGYEVASKAENGQILLRTVERAQGDLADYLRPMMNTQDTLSAAWVGEDSLISGSDQIELAQWAVASEPVRGFLEAACIVLGNMNALYDLKHANLLPQSLMNQRDMETAKMCVRQAVLLFVLALATVFISLKIINYRYQALSDQLDAEIELIQDEGEAVGRKRDLLKVVQAAQTTRNDFALVMEGLHEKTPEDLTYSQVTLDAQGVLLLRGQAISLGLPFLLHESLDPLPMFDAVEMLGASQNKRGKGTVAEFKAKARFIRREEDGS